MVDFFENEKCKICNKKGLELFSKKYSDKIFKTFFSTYYGQNQSEKLITKLNNVKYILLRCDQCKFIWQKYSLSKDLSYFLYEHIIDKDISLKKSITKFKNQRDRNRKEISKILSFFGEKNLNLLDFGAGWGHWLNSGDKDKFNAYAFELSPTRKEFLTLNNIKIVDYDTVYKYSGFFHYIRLDQLLEHLDNLNEALKTVKFLAKKNCIIHISVPDGSRTINNFKNIKITKGPIQPLEHLNCFSRKSLKKLFNMHGFRCLDLNKIIKLNIRDFDFDKLSIKSILYDLKNYNFSTTILFINE